MKSKAIAFLSALAMLLFAAAAAAQEDEAASKKVVRVGVVLDGPSPRITQALDLIKKELTGITKREFDVVFDPKKHIQADWSAAGIKKAVDQLLADDEVDVVLAHGVVASNEVVTRKDLPKPCVAPFVLNEQVQGLAGTDGGKVRRKNLSYIVWRLDLERDLKAFRQLGDFKRVAFVSNAYFAAAMPQLTGSLEPRAKALGVTLVPVPVKESADEALKLLPKDVDAVYVAPNPQMPLSEIDKLAKGLKERHLPSFSWFGRAEVERGLLAGLGTPEDIVRLARRVALNTQSILLGEDASRLVTAFKQHEQLVVNLGTARAINIWPNWSVLTDAVLIGKKRENVRRRLTLKSAVKEAMRSNLDLAASKRNVLAGSQDIRAARANLLPRLEINAGASIIDADRAGFGNAERTIQWGGSLTQSIYSEKAWSNLAIQKHLQKTRKQERATLKLDVTRNVAIAYLNLLKAQTVERIQRENLRLSRDNLALARVRRQIGTSGPGEVFRWEAQIANSRRDLIASAAQRNQAEIAVNQLLNRPQEEAFVAAETALADKGLLSSEKKFRDYLNNPFRFRVFREFMVREGIAAAPEIKQINAALRATKRQMASNKRSLYLPSVGLSASVTHRFFQDGEGSEPTEFPPLPGGGEIDFPSPNNLDWMVGLQAKLPLYEGGARYAAIDKSEHEYGKLRLEKKSVKTKIEQRIRSALHRAGASFPAIQLSRDAANAARGNLEVVSDAYSRGAASIITLLDAQNQALVADLAAANAVYEFLSDLMEVERAVGRFGFFTSSDDRQRFFSRLDAFQRAQASRQGARTAPVR